MKKQNGKPQRKSKRPLELRYPVRLEHIPTDVLQHRITNGRARVHGLVAEYVDLYRSCVAQGGRTRHLSKIHREAVAPYLSVLNYSWKQVHNELEERKAATREAL